MKKKILLLGFIAFTLGSFAQVGINTTVPDSSAVLDLKSSNKGLLIPTMTTTQREAMQLAPPATGLADGLLVYDKNYKRFYFWDGSVSKWLVLNNWRKEYTSNISDAEHLTILLMDTIENGSNVGIGQLTPHSKLTVNGNISIGATNTAAPDSGAYIDGKVRIGSGSGTNAKLEIEGTATATDSITASNFWGKGTVPVGFVGMYSGATAGLFDGNGVGIADTKMEGWAICNGYNSLTPNLRGRFIVGATAGPNPTIPANASEINKSYNVGDIVDGNGDSGENTHVLTETEMPNHTHSIDHGHSINDLGHSHSIDLDDANGSGGVDDAGESGEGSDATGSSSSNITINDYTGTSGNTGTNQAHENRPPYYAVYYIMRIN